MLSLQASYAAPLILLAQNRQEARDRVQYERDRDVDARTRADMEFLAREMAALRMSVGEVATRDFLRSELRSLLAELESGPRADSDEYGRRSRRSLVRHVGEPQPGHATQVTAALWIRASIPRSRSRSPNSAWSNPSTSGPTAASR